VPVLRRGDFDGHQKRAVVSAAGRVGEDEGRRVIRGIIAPPALPIGSAPIVAGRPEHVATKDEGAEAFRYGAHVNE
jgi:hypothetical protein